MNIDEALEKAKKEPTLVDALSWICVWESERAIKQAIRNNKVGYVDADGKGWDTCFKHCIERVMEVYKAPTECSKCSLQDDPTCEQYNCEG